MLEAAPCPWNWRDFFYELYADMCMCVCVCVCVYIYIFILGKKGLLAQGVGGIIFYKCLVYIYMYIWEVGSSCPRFRRDYFL